MPSLYNIGQQYESLAQLHDDATDEDAQRIVNQWLEEADGALVDKTTGCIRAIRQWEADAKAQQEEADRLLRLAKAGERRVQRLKLAMKEVFERAGMTSLTTAAGRLTVQGAGGKQAVVGDVPDIEAFEQKHPHLVKTTKALDKSAAHAALMLGETIPGLSLAERGTILVIR